MSLGNRDNLNFIAKRYNLVSVQLDWIIAVELLWSDGIKWKKLCDIEEKIRSSRWNKAKNLKPGQSKAWQFDSTLTVLEKNWQTDNGKVSWFRNKKQWCIILPQEEQKQHNKTCPYRPHALELPVIKQFAVRPRIISNPAKNSQIALTKALNPPK